MSEPRKFNELKIMVLEYLDEYGSATNQQISSGLNLDLNNTKVLMTRLRKHQQLVKVEGLLPKETRGRKALVFSITERGRGRLNYLKEKQKYEGIYRL